MAENIYTCCLYGVLDGINGAIIFSSINHLIISGMLLGTAFLSNSNILFSTSFINFEVCNSSYVGVLLFNIKAPTSFTSSTTTTNITIFNFTTFQINRFECILYRDSVKTSVIKQLQLTESEGYYVF